MVLYGWSETQALEKGLSTMAVLGTASVGILAATSGTVLLLSVASDHMSQPTLGSGVGSLNP